MWLYGRIIEATSWTLPQVDALELPDVRDLLDHWREEPPVGVCVRAWLGIKPAEREEAPSLEAAPREVSEEAFASLAAQWSAMAEKMNGGR